VSALGPQGLTVLLMLCQEAMAREALCRRRHKASYADLFVMPTWQEVRQVGAVSCLERSA
jgi:hypothetical protein